MGRGDVRALLLSLLAEQPRHGYDLIQELESRSAGGWRPSPGSVYPILSQLQDEGLVRVEEAEGRRVVHLTATGQAYVAEHADELAAAWEQVIGTGDEPAAQLRHVGASLAAAVVQVVRAGADAQVRAASEVLVEARKSIYRILAQDGDEGPAGSSGSGSSGSGRS
ncbi:MAG: PadR family transcriptional regulator [Actinomycetes bacterium]